MLQDGLNKSGNSTLQNNIYTAIYSVFSQTVQDEQVMLDTAEKVRTNW